MNQKKRLNKRRCIGNWECQLVLLQGPKEKWDAGVQSTSVGTGHEVNGRTVTGENLYIKVDFR